MRRWVRKLRSREKLACQADVGGEVGTGGAMMKQQSVDDIYSLTRGEVVAVQVR